MVNNLTASEQNSLETNVKQKPALSKDSGKGLLVIYTGRGKGKTTAALGLSLRALGHGQHVAFIQFIKGRWKYGEMEAANRFAGLLDFHIVGRGFTWKSDDLQKDFAAARSGWELAQKIIRQGRHRLIVLDELTYLITYKILTEEEILAVLQQRNPTTHVVITGRGASEALIQAADLVTEMQEIKHPYAAGIKAQQGIEF